MEERMEYHHSLQWCDKHSGEVAEKVDCVEVCLYSTLQIELGEGVVMWPNASTEQSGLIPVLSAVVFEAPKDT